MAEEEEDELDPIGPDFWIGQLLMIVAVFLGILITANLGFTQAARFSQHEEFRLARNTLAVVKTELEENLREVRAARDRFQQNQDGPIELGTENLVAASTKPYMTLVDPSLLYEIERLFTHPIPEFVKAMATRRLGEGERKEGARLFGEILERSEKVVLPLLAAQEKALAEAEQRLEAGP